MTLLFVILITGSLRADATTITGLDANSKPVVINGTGHYTLVMYTNPDLEDESRALTLALDPYRSKTKFALVRVVDLRGGVPPGMRSIVRVHVRDEETKEAARLKKAGITPGNPAPIIPDFSGATLNALGWDSIYEQVHMVLFDPTGKEIKRMDDVSDAKQLTKMLNAIF